MANSPTTSEGFEALLLEVREGAQAELADFGGESIEEGAQDDPKIKDARAIWHAAEFALAMLMPGRYIPNRAVLDDATELIDRLGESKDTGGQG